MNLDVVIIGAGLVGLGLARSLNGCGLRIGLIEPAVGSNCDQDEWDARVYAISPGSRDYLEACGAWARIDATRITPVEAMQIHGDRKWSSLEFNAYDAGLPQLCDIVESREIERALREALAGQPDLYRIAAQQPCSLAFDDQSVEVALANGDRVNARLVVGADGAQSWVRAQAGIETKTHDYRQVGVVANFAIERGHQHIARQWFRADGVLAFLPLPGNRVSMVWSTWEAHAARLLSLDPVTFAAEVEAASELALGAMHVLGTPRGFPLRLLRVAELTRPRVALVGDAAHTVHPLAGQGVNLGFQDVRELAHVFATRGAQDDCGDARLLRRYARARAEPVALMQTTTDALQRFFGSRASGFAWLRNAGLNATDRAPGLKKILIEHALG